MALDTRVRFLAMALTHQEEVRKAFFQAVEDLRKTVNVDDLESAIAAGNLEEVLSLLELGPELIAPIEQALKNVYHAGGVYALDSLPKRDPRDGSALVIRFQGSHPNALAWAELMVGNLVREITEAQKAMIQEAIIDALSRGINPKKVALDLVGRVIGGKRTGGMIGLTSYEKGILDRFLTKLIEEGLAEKAIERAYTLKQNELLLTRGQRIARTEMLSALHAGRYEGYRQLLDKGKVSPQNMTKTWDSSGDGRVRDSHDKMDGQTVQIDQPFLTPTGARLMHPLDRSLGAPASEIINCRCWNRVRINFLAGVK